MTTAPLREPRPIVVRKRPHVAGSLVLVTLMLFAVTVMSQYLAGAFHSEFGSHPDEAAHVVTGLMVHDFLRSTGWSDPIGFAESYYLHYPKVAIGKWPPVFYIIQSTWMIIFGDHRISLLLLMAGICAATAGVVFQTARRETGTVAAIVLSLGFISLPIVRGSVNAVMSELLIALFVSLAALSFAGYLDTAGSRRKLTAFVVFASLAILTKASGLMLVLVPPLCLIFTGNLAFLRKAELWLAALAVAVVAGPFHYLTLSMQRNGMQHESFSWEFVVHATTFYPRCLWEAATPMVAVFALLGLAVRILIPAIKGQSVDVRLAAMAALLLSLLIFHLFVPTGYEPRYMLPGCIPSVIFAGCGVEWLWRQATGLRMNPVVKFGVGVAAIGVLVLLEEPVRKEWSGFQSVIQHLGQRERSAICLVSSDSQGEGMLIAEAALHDRRRPETYNLRASKILASDRWSGAEYRAKFSATEELSKFLNSSPIQTLILDTSLEAQSSPEHHRQLIQMVAAYPQVWRIERRFDLVRDGREFSGAIVLYQRSHDEASPAADIQVDLTPMLGRVIELEASQLNHRGETSHSTAP